MSCYVSRTTKTTKLNQLPALTQWFDCIRAGLQQNAWSR